MGDCKLALNMAQAGLVHGTYNNKLLQKYVRENFNETFAKMVFKVKKIEVLLMVDLMLYC